MRNIDSRTRSLRFDCCVFLFHSFSAVTFATQSGVKADSLYSLRVFRILTLRGQRVRLKSRSAVSPNLILINSLCCQWCLRPNTELAVRSEDLDRDAEEFERALITHLELQLGLPFVK